MFNNYKIIIDSGKSKQKIFIVFDLPEAAIVLAVFIASYYLLSEFILSPIMPFVIAIGIAFIIGFMFIEMPNHLSIWEHIKLVVNYFFKEPKAYYYYINKITQKVAKEDKNGKKKRKEKEEQGIKGFTPATSH
ncbi:hypothetical protein [Breznakia pachnodae]|uniref:PrgI family protein n=1 Tax=Breznakia pachnodae TaxID=265178 RepID=A0ABU0E3U4_9FIRM|nr:hypothetical protein [Breznakia pachnodae]MDQ0361563.1 hypothetical protein [Breznakia pachnodae]